MTDETQGKKIRQYKDKNEFDRELEFVLGFHIGSNRGISRLDLVIRMYGPDAVPSEYDDLDNNSFDRIVRDGIERLRLKGSMICNINDGSGYYVAATRNEYDRFTEHFLGPAYKKLQSVRAMDATADKKWGKVPKETPPDQFKMEFV